MYVGWQSGDVYVKTTPEHGSEISLAMRFSTSAGNRSWSLMLQLGLSAWLPSSDGEVLFTGKSETLQRAELVFLSGVLFRFF